LNQDWNLDLVLLCELLGRGVKGVMASSAERDARQIRRFLRHPVRAGVRRINAPKSPARGAW
jgi:hypothetical protein